MVQSGARCIMASTPTQERIRLTVTITPEVHEIFSRMAETMGVSLGRCIGDWLSDTAEGAQFVAHKMVEARKAPMTVMRELQAYARGAVVLADETAEEFRRKRAADRAPRGTATAPASARPPSSNTGGKVPRTRGKP